MTFYGFSDVKMNERYPSARKIHVQAGRCKWILHWKLNYYVCCLRDVSLKIERDHSNSICKNLISGLESRWTSQHLSKVIPDYKSTNPTHLPWRRPRSRRTWWRTARRSMVRSRCGRPWSRTACRRGRRGTWRTRSTPRASASPCMTGPATG